MNKKQIKDIILNLYGKKTPIVNNNKISLDVENEKFLVLTKFPQLKDIIVDLFTDQFELFIQEIQWVAPRPTLFKIILTNNQFFFLSYNGRSWLAQVDGKKYWLANLKEQENASGALSRILKYGNQELPASKNDTEDEEEPSTTGEELPEKPEEEEEQPE
jgi:hypothetical protein